MSTKKKAATKVRTTLVYPEYNPGTVNAQKAEEEVAAAYGEQEEVRVLDRWKGRLQMRTCATCMHYVPKLPTGDKEGPIRKVGRCRRHSPCQVELGWPAVFPGDWCGDYKIDENKI